MADNLRPLRIRLADPTNAPALLAFLRQRACVVEQVSPHVIDAWPPPLLHERNGNGVADLQPDEVACAACGYAIERALSRLGSPRCHDCREGTHAAHPTAVPSDPRFQVERARLELRAYLRAWRAANAGAAAALTD